MFKINVTTIKGTFKKKNLKYTRIEFLEEKKNSELQI